MENMLRRLLGEDIELTTLPATSLWSVKADFGQIEQVILNLAVSLLKSTIRPESGRANTMNVSNQGEPEGTPAVLAVDNDAGSLVALQALLDRSTVGSCRPGPVSKQ